MKASKKIILSCGVLVAAFSFSFYLNQGEQSALSKIASKTNRKHPQISQLPFLPAASTPTSGNNGLYKQTCTGEGTAHSACTCDGTGSACSKNYAYNTAFISVVRSGDVAQIQSYVTDNYTSLSEAVPDEILDGVIDGSISTSYNESTTSTSNAKNVVFSNGSGILFVAQYL